MLFVQVAIGAQLTEADLTMLAGRKRQLEIFQALLDPDSDVFESAVQRIGGPEKVWQKFSRRTNGFSGMDCSREL